MRRLLLAACLTMAALFHFAGPAAACINDRETAKVEQDFKANYEFKSGYQEPTPQSPAAEESWGPVAATGSGVVLMLAAAGLVTFNIRRFG